MIDLICMVTKKRSKTVKLSNRPVSLVFNSVIEIIFSHKKISKDHPNNYRDCEEIFGPPRHLCLLDILIYLETIVFSFLQYCYFF